MLFRLLATLFFVVAIAVVLVRQPVKRGNAWRGVFGGVLFIVVGVARAWGDPRVELSEILLLQLDPQDRHQYIASFFVMLGYGLALGALAAMPWLIPGTVGEAGTEQREAYVAWSFWREPLVRYLRWWLGIAVILLLWRVIGASYG
jgi:hypothetical protein